MAILYATRRPSWLVLLLAFVIGLIGLVLLLGGAYLIYVGGSPYYALAGLGLIATAWLLWRGSGLALWFYILVYAATLVWAVWEAGLHGWALVPRVVAPAVMLLLIVAVLPALLPRYASWRMAVCADLVIIVAAGIIGFTLPSTNVTDHAGDLPPAGTTSAMADPSLRQTGADWPANGGIRTIDLKTTKTPIGDELIAYALP